MYLASLVNLGMIWCFGFFFLEILDDFDEESQQRDDGLASLDDVDRNWAAFRQRLLRNSLKGITSNFVPYYGKFFMVKI